MGILTLAREVGDYLTERETWRMWSLAAQDGIISTAFAGAGADAATLLVATVTIVVSYPVGAAGTEI